MTRLIELPGDFSENGPWGQDGARGNCAQLEEGNILFFPKTPFEMPADDVRFLLSQQRRGGRIHKNIAYRPSQNRLTGHRGNERAQIAKLRDVLGRYSQQAIGFAARLLAPYAGSWRVDFASFRPQQEKGRHLRLRARNDLLHLDSFPTRPANGDRILRIFTNLNPSEARVWNTSETFEELARRFAGSGAMLLPKALRPPRRVAFKVARAVGLQSLARPPYDDWMLRFHHFLKANEEFQHSAPRSRWGFPPGSTWLAFTDMVSHAVLSGQFAVEQTLIISRHSLLRPEKAPITILERMAGCRLTLD